MIVDEFLAKNYICGTRYDNNTGPIMCHGYGCMMWQKHFEIKENGNKHMNPSLNYDRVGTDKGYCGLVSK